MAIVGDSWCRVVRPPDRMVDVYQPVAEAAARLLEPIAQRIGEALFDTPQRTAQTILTRVAERRATDASCIRAQLPSRHAPPPSPFPHRVPGAPRIIAPVDDDPPELAPLRRHAPPAHAPRGHGRLRARQKARVLTF